MVTIVGRLTGPKGELCYRLLTECIDTQRYHVKVITGSAMTERFRALQDKVKFPGYTTNVAGIMASSDLVIGAGRVAIESLLCGRPTLIIGEASCVGLIDEQTYRSRWPVTLAILARKILISIFL
ncbi:hypothetical protein ACT691_19305 [Vibrio metschnikovii]